MIFSGGLADKVLDGTKTQTRRAVRVLLGDGSTGPCSYTVGRTYAIQRKRGEPGVGRRIRVLSIDSVPTFPISFEDAQAEGFDNPSAFEAKWHELYGNSRPGRCWRIEFELVNE